MLIWIIPKKATKLLFKKCLYWNILKGVLLKKVLLKKSQNLITNTLTLYTLCLILGVIR
jgi:hypothetical protein